MHNFESKNLEICNVNLSLEIDDKLFYINGNSKELILETNFITNYIKLLKILLKNFGLLNSLRIWYRFSSKLKFKKT